MVQFTPQFLSQITQPTATPPIQQTPGRAQVTLPFSAPQYGNYGTFQDTQNQYNYSTPIIYKSLWDKPLPSYMFSGGGEAPAYDFLAHTYSGGPGTDGRIIPDSFKGKTYGDWFSSPEAHSDLKTDWQNGVARSEQDNKIEANRAAILKRNGIAMMALFGGAAAAAEGAGAGAAAGAGDTAGTTGAAAASGSDIPYIGGEMFGNPASAVAAGDPWALSGAGGLAEGSPGLMDTIGNSLSNYGDKFTRLDTSNPLIRKGISTGVNQAFGGGQPSPGSSSRPSQVRTGTVNPYLVGGALALGGNYLLPKFQGIGNMSSPPSASIPPIAMPPTSSIPPRAIPNTASLDGNGFNTSLLGFATPGSSFIDGPAFMGGAPSIPTPSTPPPTASTPPSNVQQLADIAQQELSRYNNIYAPQETALGNQVNQYNDPAYWDTLAGRASADVMGSYGKQQADLAHQLAASGINPGSPAYASALSSLGLNRAMADATAQTNARLGGQQAGISLRGNFVKQGFGLPSVAAGIVDSSGRLKLGQDQLAGQIGMNDANNATKTAITNASIAGQKAIEDAKLGLSRDQFNAVLQYKNSQQKIGSITRMAGSIWNANPGGIQGLVSSIFNGGGSTDMGNFWDTDYTNPFGAVATDPNTQSAIDTIGNYIGSGTDASSWLGNTGSGLDLGNSVADSGSFANSIGSSDLFSSWF